jgi:predicted RNA-binding protein with PUA-like domain
VDPSQFDPQSKYHDPKATPERPRWDCVRLQYRRTFPQLLTLETLRRTFSADELLVVRPGNRLSIVPVESAVAQRLLELLAG